MKANFMKCRKPGSVPVYSGIFFTISLFVCLQSTAQVTGTKTIGVDYVTLAAAINDLNTVGISGPVVINVPAGYTETAPVGGFQLGSAVLNASTSGSNTLVIQKNGAGANPLLTAFTGTSTTLDGIFFLKGVDFVSINGINLTESASNTTPTTQMEWGYALVKLQSSAPFDGCQNVTIANCTVTLNRTNTNTVGIYAANHIATSTTSLTITAPGDITSNCKFFSNTIQNTVTCVSLRGFAAPSPYSLYDQNNDVGGSSAATGNTFQNYGGTAAGAAVNFQNQNNANASNNSINNVAGGGAVGTNALYGVYVQSGTNVSVNANGNIVNLTQGTTSSATYGVYIGCSGTGAVTVNSNTFTASGGSSGVMYMIYMASGNNTVSTNSNNFRNINVATTSTLGLIYHSSAASPAFITNSNNFTSGTSTPYVTKTGSGGTLACYYNNSGSSSGTTTHSNNSFTNVTATGSTTFYGIYENNGGSGQNKFAHNNVVSNISTGGLAYGINVAFCATESVSNNTVNGINAGSTIYGIYIGSSSLDTINNNRVSNLASTGGTVYGMYLGGGTTVNVYLDTVFSLSTAGSSSAAYGVYVVSGTTQNIFRNKIYDVSSTGASGSAYGIYMSTGTTTVYNNLVGDIRTPAHSGTAGTQLSGIHITGGTSHGIYYNTVFINASSTGTNFGSNALYASTTPTVTLRNNILVNTSTPAGTGIVSAYRRSSTTLTSYDAASNNNLFYAGTPGPSNVIFYDGTTTYPTLASFTSLVTPRDGNSVTENPPFLSTSGASPSFLHISTSVPTQIESGALNIAGITTDYENTIRQGNPGYSGTGTAPDIGAVEGNYMPVDLSAPNIIYTPLADACSAGDRVLTATITDASGVPVAGTTVPRVYFRKNSGPWISAAGTLTSGTATSGTWNFTISAAAMGGLAISDTVQYFVIAQDIQATPNVGANPGTGLVASNVNTVTTFPTTPNGYLVLPVLSGTYNVGVGGAFATITAAVNAYNTSCISGPVLFRLTDATYPSETFPITIDANVAASATNTLTIRPAPGMSPVITGSATAIFVLNGADYVTIDGSNNPGVNTICPLSASTRNMSISNTSTSTTSAVVWIQTATGPDGATNNIIRNCNIIGSGSANTLFGIGMGGTTIGYTSSGNGNNNNRIENNSVVAAQTGIFTRGASAANKNSSNVINQNVMTGSGTMSLRNNGIFANFENNITISGNYLANITNGISNDIIGINLGFGNNAVSTSSTTGSDVTNATVTHNTLTDIKQTNTYTCLGIAVAGVTSGTTLIANNMISGVVSNGTSGDFSSGIFIGGATGGTTEVFYNAVNVIGATSGGSYPNFGIAISGTNPIVDLKNNIFVNNNTTGPVALQYAIGLAYTTYSNLSSDRNDFFSVGTNLAVVGSLTTGGTPQHTLANWRATTGKDLSSKNINPVFASSSDLHVLPVAANEQLMDSGVVVVVTEDYDCMPRSATPDIGINEFAIPPCTTVAVGTVTPAIPSFCESGATAITISGAASGIGTTYQWLSSPDSITWTPISGAVTNSYTTDTLTSTTFYRIIASCSFSGAVDSGSTSVTIHPLPVVSVSPDSFAICAGGSGVGLLGSGAYIYTWSPAAGLSSTFGTFITANPTASTTYVVTGTDIFGCSATDTAEVIVSSPPGTFSVTPSALLMCASDTAHVLTATGPAVIPSSGPITDSTGTISVVVPDATPAGTTSAINITGIPGGATITNVSVRFNTTMTFDGDLTFNLTAPNGATINLVNRRGGGGDNFVNTVVSSAGGLSLASAAAPFTGTFTADLSMTAGTTGLPITTSVWNTLYSIPNGAWVLSARDWAGGDVATITSWTITIDYTYSPAITWFPTTGLFTDAAATIPYTGTAATSVYAKPPTTTTYTATLSTGGCSSSASAVVSVNPAPTAFTVTGGGGYCAGSAGVNIGLSGSQLGIQYQLYNGSATVGASVTGTGSPINFGIFTATGIYSVSATDPLIACTNNMTGTVTVSVNPLPTAFAVTGGGTYCTGSPGVNVGLSGSTAGIHYQLYVGTTAVGTPVAGTGSALSFGLQTVTGTYTATAIDSVTGCANHMIGSVTVNTTPLPTVYTVTGGGGYCPGDAGVGVGLSGSNTGIDYQLYNGSTVVGGAVPGTGSALSFGVQPAGTYTVLATNIATTCTVSMSGTAVVSLNPVPAIYSVSGGGTYCAGGTGVLVNLTGSDAGAGYQLYLGSVPVGAPLTGSGSAISFGLQTAPGVYTVMATNAVACSSNMDGSATVSVNPGPTAYAMTGGGVYCAGGSGIVVGLAASDPGVNYQLVHAGSPLGSPLQARVVRSTLACKPQRERTSSSGRSSPQVVRPK
jgi:subtilisin-like proprotein convertase family protein